MVKTAKCHQMYAPRVLAATALRMDLCRHWRHLTVHAAVGLRKQRLTYASTS